MQAADLNSHVGGAWDARTIRTDKAESNPRIVHLRTILPMKCVSPMILDFLIRPKRGSLSINPFNDRSGVWFLTSAKTVDGDAEETWKIRGSLR